MSPGAQWRLWRLCQSPASNERARRMERRAPVRARGQRSGQSVPVSGPAWSGRGSLGSAARARCPSARDPAGQTGGERVGNGERRYCASSGDTDTNLIEGQSGWWPGQPVIHSVYQKNSNKHLHTFPPDSPWAQSLKLCALGRCSRRRRRGCRFIEIAAISPVP